MTETEWLECTEPTPMLEFLRDIATERKLRLFNVACCRLIGELITDATSQRALDVAERFADGQATENERATFSGGRYFESKSLSCCLESATSAVGWAVARPLTATEADYCQSHAKAACIHDAADKGLWVFDGENDYMVVTQPFREKANNEHSALLRDIFGNPYRPVTIDPRWLTSTVMDLAQVIYDEKAFDRMPILADALMDAGCDNEEIIAHCRGEGPHVRGCWIVDLLLGKE